MRLLDRVFSALELLWEIPVSLLSFIFYKATRFCLQVVSLYYMRGKAQTSRWRVLAAEFLAEPLALPRVMTTGPRWNTHAIIAVAGPLEVSETISLNVATANQSASPWTIVVYRFPRTGTVTSIGSCDEMPRNRWSLFPLRPGQYMLFLRYYNWSANPELPAVKVDGEDAVGGQPIPPDVNSFYHTLRDRKNLLYLFLSYYVFTLLRFRRWLPHSFVEREYLPVGNPETRFYYGSLATGESLRCELDAQLLHTCDVYFTLYDRASFPISWYRIQEEAHTTSKCTEKSFFLFRIHDKAAARAAPIGEQIRITVCR